MAFRLIEGRLVPCSSYTLHATFACQCPDKGSALHAELIASLRPEPVQCPGDVFGEQCEREQGHTGACGLISDSLSDY